MQVRRLQSAPCQFWKQEHLSLAPQMPLAEQPFGQAAVAAAMRVAMAVNFFMVVGGVGK